MQGDLFEELDEEKHKGVINSGAKPELSKLAVLVSKEIMASGITVELIKCCGKHLCSKTNLNKAAYCKALAEALCDPVSFLTYFNSFSKGGQQIMLDLAFKWVVPKEDIIEKVLDGRKNQKRYEYWDSFSRSEQEKIPLAFVIGHCYERSFSLPQATKKCLQIQLEKLRPQKMEIPDGEFKKLPGYFSEKDGLEFFLNSVQIIQVLEDSKFFEREPGSPILKGTLTKLAKVVPLKPFTDGKEMESATPGIWPEECSFDGKTIERYVNARASLPLGFMSVAFAELAKESRDKNIIRNLCSDPKTMYRKILESFLSSFDASYDVKHLYPHITIPGGSFYDVQEYRQNVLHNIITVVKKYPPAVPTEFFDWIDKLTEKGLPHFFNSSTNGVYAHVFRRCYYSYRDLNIEPERERVYGEMDYLRYAHLQSYNSFFLTLASMGLFEVSILFPGKHPKTGSEAVRWKNELNEFRYGKIGYIKMTPLGAYCFGLTDAIEIQGMKTFAPPRLDDASLIVHIDKGDKTMQIFLAPFCTCISQTLYKADGSKLKNLCRSKSEIESVFSTLGARSGGRLPKIWRQLKDDMLASFASLAVEDDWLVISLEKQGLDLVRSIEKLARAGHCVKMEGKRVAVKKNRLNQLIKKLEAEGFKFE